MEKKGTWWIFKRRRNVPNEVLLILWALLKIYDFLEIFFFWNYSGLSILFKFYLKNYVLKIVITL